MGSIFTKIVQRELPGYIVAEEERFLAFLDINPLMEGHTLVIPKQETDYLFDLDDELYLGLHAFAKPLALAIQKAVPCQRIASVILGLEVPHAHIHLIPMNSEKDISFSKQRPQFSKEDFEKTLQRIKNHLH